VRALLVANANDADPGFVGHRFRRHGYAFDECPREHPGEWPQLAGHDLVVTLGSDWSVYWPQVAPSVAAEIALIRAADARGVPVFAICFGSQVAACALGGTAARAAAPEIGWHQIDSDVAAITSGPWLQWHADVVTVPARATELARNSMGPQAWRLGRTLCTQFHPEATETIVARWSANAASELGGVGTTPDLLMAATRTNVIDSRHNAGRLVDWFTEHVAGT
jgi:GMP synthase-like glutamine amidotransferase